MKPSTYQFPDLRPETLARMNAERAANSLERFHQCVQQVWDGPMPEVYASAVIGFGKRGGVFQ